MISPSPPVDGSPPYLDPLTFQLEVEASEALHLVQVERTLLSKFVLTFFYVRSDNVVHQNRFRNSDKHFFPAMDKVELDFPCDGLFLPVEFGGVVSPPVEVRGKES